MLAALAAVSVSACTREPSAAPVPEGAGQGPEYVSGEEKNYVDGWVRIRLADDAGALRALEHLHEEGAQAVLLTMGGAGAYFSDGRHAWGVSRGVRRSRATGQSTKRLPGWVPRR